jgi:lipoprotein-releasing system permease protein
LGVALGLGLSVAFTTFALNPDGTPIIAFYINYGFIALSGGIAILASLVASLIPARKSLKLNPIEVIRNG